MRQCNVPNVNLPNVDACDLEENLKDGTRQCDRGYILKWHAHRPFLYDPAKRCRQSSTRLVLCCPRCRFITADGIYPGIVLSNGADLIAHLLSTSPYSYEKLEAESPEVVIRLHTAQILKR
jgi:hypothetical protein